MAWIVGRLSDYLKRREDHTFTGRSYAVIGDKGIGKTILVESALDRLRKGDLSERAIFLNADCRRLRGRREVLTQTAQAAVQELHKLWQITQKPAIKGLLDTALVLRTLCNFNADAELKVVHESLLQYKGAIDIKGGRSLLANLSVNFGVSLERSEKQVKELIGKIRFDEPRLCRAFCDFFRDVREQDLHVVLHLDNIDELRHEYYQEEEIRKETRKDVDGVLALRDAPIALVVCMRTYYAGSLPREVTQRLRLAQLSATDLQEVVLQRVGDEVAAKELRSALGQPPLKESAERLAAIARTPLSFLMWSQFLYEHAEQPLSVVLDRFLSTHYSTIPVETLRRLAARFPGPDRPLSRTDILDICEQNLALYNQLLDRQAVLPQDFWHPVDFTLDPELDFLFWLHKGQAV